MRCVTSRRGGMLPEREAVSILGLKPSIPFISVPVLFGMVGGVMITVGTLGLIVIKRRVDPRARSARMALRDYGVLVALNVLGVKSPGLRLCPTRADHLRSCVPDQFAAVITGFAFAPYTKFVHFVYCYLVYCYLAMVKDDVGGWLKRQTSAPASAHALKEPQAT